MADERYQRAGWDIAAPLRHSGDDGLHASQHDTNHRRSADGRPRLAARPRDGISGGHRAPYDVLRDLHDPARGGRGCLVRRGNEAALWDAADDTERLIACIDEGDAVMKRILPAMTVEGMAMRFPAWSQATPTLSGALIAEAAVHTRHALGPHANDAATLGAGAPGVRRLVYAVVARVRFNDGASLHRPIPSADAATVSPVPILLPRREAPSAPPSVPSSPPKISDTIVMASAPPRLSPQR